MKADEIINKASRSMLVKILKGSKDKKVLNHVLEKCPSYRSFSHLKMHEIEIIVDWMIFKKYLRIVYDGRLPMVVYDAKGWELNKPILAYELIEKLSSNDAYDVESLIEDFKYINREIVFLLLDIILDDDIQTAKEFLYLWEPNVSKKVAKKIGVVIRELESKVKNTKYDILLTN